MRCVCQVLGETHGTAVMQEAYHYCTSPLLDVVCARASIHLLCREVCRSRLSRPLDPFAAHVSPSGPSHLHVLNLDRRKLPARDTEHRVCVLQYRSSCFYHGGGTSAAKKCVVAETRHRHAVLLSKFWTQQTLGDGNTQVYDGVSAPHCIGQELLLIGNTKGRVDGCRRTSTIVQHGSVHAVRQPTVADNHIVLMTFIPSTFVGSRRYRAKRPRDTEQGGVRRTSIILAQVPDKIPIPYSTGNKSCFLLQVDIPLPDHGNLLSIL